MKYVIFRQGPLLIPVVLPDAATHSCALYEKGRSVSAGFFHISAMGTIKVDPDKHSESLDMGPQVKRDTYLLNGLFMNANTAAFAVKLMPRFCVHRSKCNEALYGENGFVARCTRGFGVEHSHSDYSAEEAVKRGTARRILKGRV